MPTGWIEVWNQKKQVTGRTAELMNTGRVRYNYRMCMILPEVFDQTARVRYLYRTCPVLAPALFLSIHYTNRYVAGLWLLDLFSIFYILCG